MVSVRDSLKAINGYPIPQLTLETVAAERGLDLEQDLTPQSARAKEYLLAKADLLKWLANAPTVSQGGQSYSLAADQRTRFIAEARGILNQYGDEADKTTTVYGYKGSRL